MKKLSYIFIFLMAISCTSLKADETVINPNDVIEQNQTIKIENEDKKALYNQIRVKLSNPDKNDFDIYFSDDFSINGKEITNKKKINVKYIDNKIYIDNDEFEKVDISNKGIMTIGNNKYYGDIYIKQVDSKLQIVNFVDIEKYLLGVVPYEMPSSFPLEALKAQTVIARSYAQTNINRKKKDFDLYDDTRSQVYSGIPKSRLSNVEKAIKETKGEVITYNGRVIDALFHSYSGGYTASAKEVYGNDIEYLKPVEDIYSKGVPMSVLTWTYLIPKSQFEKEIGFIPLDYDIEYTESNRVKYIILYNEDRSLEKKYTGAEFRRKYSTSKIKSTAYNINIENGDIKVVGSGYGHGVGFSQWSSKTMAEDEKMSYKDIINFFYTGVKIEKRGM
ncbi:MAG: SpoIID/LytB domain-containing protein [Streptobacillus sp.]